MIKFGVGAVLRQPEPNLSNDAIGSGYCRTSHSYSNQNYFPLWPSFPLLAFIYNHCMSLGLSFLSPAICALHSAQVSLTPMMHLPDLWIMVPPTCWVFYIKDCGFFLSPFLWFLTNFERWASWTWLDEGFFLLPLQGVFLFFSWPSFQKETVQLWDLLGNACCINKNWIEMIELNHLHITQY